MTAIDFRDRLDEVLGLLEGCLGDHDALAPAWALLDGNGEALNYLLDEIGLGHAGKDLRDQAAFCVATVISAYRQARRDGAVDTRTAAVRELLRKVEKAAVRIQATLRNGFDEKFNHRVKADLEAREVANHARMLIEEAALTIVAGRVFRPPISRGPMDLLRLKRVSLSPLQEGLRIRRGYDAAARRVSQRRSVPLASAVRAAVKRDFPAGAAAQIEAVVSLIESGFFGGDMVRLLIEATASAREALPDGRNRMGPPPGLTLAWGCLELMVSFRPPPIKPSSRTGGDLEALMDIVHDIAIPDATARGNQIGVDGLKMAVAAWAEGRPACLFCDDAAMEREQARIAAVRAEVARQNRERPPETGGYHDDEDSEETAAAMLGQGRGRMWPRRTVDT